MIITLHYRKKAVFVGDKEIMSAAEFGKLSQEDRERTIEKDVDNFVDYDADRFDFVADGWIKFTNLTGYDTYVRTTDEYLGHVINIKHETPSTNINYGL